MWRLEVCETLNFYTVFRSEAPLWTCLSFTHSHSHGITNYCLPYIQAYIMQVRIILFPPPILPEKSILHPQGLFWLIIQKFSIKIQNICLDFLKPLKNYSISSKCRLHKLKNQFCVILKTFFFVFLSALFCMFEFEYMFC